jgi:hypothetical protein
MKTNQKAATQAAFLSASGWGCLAARPEKKYNAHAPPPADSKISRSTQAGSAIPQG